MIRKLFKSKETFDLSRFTTRTLDVGDRKQDCYYARLVSPNHYEVRKTARIFQYSGIRFQDDLCAGGLDYTAARRLLATLEDDLIDQHMKYKSITSDNLDADLQAVRNSPLPRQHFSLMPLAPRKEKALPAYRRKGL